MLNPNINSIKFSHKEYVKYAKHLILEKVGLKGQKRLKKAKVLIVGAGGLGCPAMLYLVALGIGYIGIIDNDIIDLSNLNRQILYNERSINSKKATSAKSKLETINSNCKIITHLHYLSNTNASEVIQYYDIIIDTSDNFKTRYIINQTCHKLNKIHIYGAIQEFEGQIGIFNYKSGIKYNDIYSQILDIENFNCSNSGILGVTAGHIGILQATQAIRIILGLAQSVNNHLIICSLLNISIIKRKIYPQTSKKNFIKKNIKIFPKPQQIISKNVFNSLKLQKKYSLAILDIRQQDEFHKSHIKNSINIPLTKFKSNQALKFIAKHQNTSIIIIYCTTVNRSTIASYILNHHRIKHYILKNT